MYVVLYEAISMITGLQVSFYIFGKTLNYVASFTKKTFFVIWCFLLTIIVTVMPSWIPSQFVQPVYCTASILFLLALTKLKPDVVISAFLLSFGIGYVLYYVASFIVFVVAGLLTSREYVSGSVLDYNTPFFFLSYSLVSALQLILSFLFFRIKRFKKGFPFLLKKYAIIITLISAGVVLVFATWIKVITASENPYTAYLYLAGVFVIGIGIYIWIKRGIRGQYKKKQEERAVEILERELAGQKEENRRLTEQNDILRVANHKVQHRLAALERSTAGLAAKIQAGCFSMDAGEELAITLEDIKRVVMDYQSDIGQLAGKNTLMSTKIKMLDDLFGRFSSQFASCKIDFKLKVNGSIPYMVENIIKQGKLETMIGDHLQNALIAMGESDNIFRSVWAIIGLNGNFYEFSVYDSGIPFEVDTLVRLGSARVTTHASNGGSGIGLMTTFEAIRECNASLVISEKMPSVSDYTKVITIRFDGKGQYIIETYRPEAFPISDRYTVKGR